MDKKFAPNWHCVMGGSLGFEVTLRVCCFLLDVFHPLADVFR